MSYDWDFYTLKKLLGYEWDFFTLKNPTSKARIQDCHRGPMTDTELRLIQPFVIIPRLEQHRQVLLQYLVSSSAPAVKTRECVLRVVNSEVGPLVPTVYKDKEILQALICEKRRATEIEKDLSTLALDFQLGATILLDYGFSKENEALLQLALVSNSPISRMAGRCAILLLATIVEMGI